MARRSGSIAELEELHLLVTQAYSTRIRQDMGDDIPTDAATLSGAAKFLKDNNITCDPADRSDLEALKAEFLAGSRARQSKAAQAAGLSAEDLVSEYGLN